MKKLSALFIAAITALATNADQPRSKAYMVSNAHLDTQWNWDVQTTISKYIWNTVNQNLFLINQFPDYIFNFEGGIKYAWMKEYYPREYELVKEQIKKGRWHVCGSSWDANDVNVPSVESQIRNILYGQQFYRTEFGVEGTDIFLPDCFGFGYTLPTIANHCGLIGFSSQKLGWRNNPFYPKGKKTPFNVGLWRGVDGSEIMMAHCFNYVTVYDNEDISHNDAIINAASQPDSPNHTLMHYYGVGDMGGSPTYGSLLSIEKGLGGNGPVEIISAESDRMYKDYLPYSAHPELPVFDGELLMDVHGTGCYTSQAAMKLYNRQNEMLGDAAERAAAAAAMSGTANYPGDKLAEGWKRMLWHQFHDDLTGTSIPRAYEFSWNDELLTLKQFSDILSDAVSAVGLNLNTDVKGIPLLIFNPLAYPSTDVVEISVPAAKSPRGVAAYDENGQKVPAQLLSYADGKASILIEASMQPGAFAVYDLRLNGHKIQTPSAESSKLSNSRYDIIFDSAGDITSIFDKKVSRQIVKDGEKIRLALFTQNQSHNWPAWEILKETIDREPESIADSAEIEIVENGPIRHTAKITRTRGDSKFIQFVSVYEGALADRIDFRNIIDWTLSNSLLKAEFPLSVANPTATYDLGVGVIQRPNNSTTAYEVYSRDWTDLSATDGSYGVTIINDGKYGWDKPDDNTLRLSLIHTPETSYAYTYQNRQDIGRHEFSYAIAPHAGDLDRAQAVRAGESLNQRFKAFIPAKHKGSLGRSFSAFLAADPAISVKALKKAEGSDSDYIVRIYDTSGHGAENASVWLSAPIISASLADGTEKPIGNASFSGHTLNVSVKPNSISTYRVKLDMPPVAKPIQQALHLPFNKKCFTYNEMRSNGNFNDGYTYAAELLPDTITDNHISFLIERHQELNGLTAKSDTINIPDNFRCVSLLAAAASDTDISTSIRVGQREIPLYVPSYTGFIGQWGHDGHTEGFLKDARVAYVGTHRHSPDSDCPYELTYMFRFDIPIDDNPGQLCLPDDENLVIFAATAHNSAPNSAPASRAFRTANRDASESAGISIPKVNLLKNAKIIGCSGYVNEDERPEHISDGDEATKWCDTSVLPNNVDFELPAPALVSQWTLTSAGKEGLDYITSSCFLQGKLNPEDPWRTIDSFTGNRKNIITRTLGAPVEVRFIRLLVTQPTQIPDTNASRIYELGIY